MSQKLKSALIAAGLTGVLAMLSHNAMADSHRSDGAMGQGSETHHHTESAHGDRADAKEHGHKGMEKKFNAIANELKLDAKQQVAWEELKRALQPKHMSQKKDREQHKKALKAMQTPERLDWMQTMFETRLNDMKQRNQAIKSFYAGLNETQKKVFDDKFFWSKGKDKNHHKGDATH